jgi:chromosome segregation ATPase
MDIQSSKKMVANLEREMGEKREEIENFNSLNEDHNRRGEENARILDEAQSALEAFIVQMQEMLLNFRGEKATLTNQIATMTTRHEEEMAGSGEEIQKLKASLSKSVAEYHDLEEKKRAETTQLELAVDRKQVKITSLTKQVVGLKADLDFERGGKACLEEALAGSFQETENLKTPLLPYPTTILFTSPLRISHLPTQIPQLHLHVFRLQLKLFSNRFLI